MKNISSILVIMLALVCQRAAAQGMLASPRGAAGDLPSAMDAPDRESLVLPSGEEYDDGSGGIVPEPVAEGTIEEFAGPQFGEMTQALNCDPLLFESSGSWLRRGYWYVEADYLMMNRGWDRKGLIIANEEAIRNSNPSGQPYIVQNVLQIDGSRPGGEGLARVKLGRFLFRDSTNRDHVAEVGFYGGARWRQESSVEASSAGGLQVTNYIDRVNPSFDGARQMDFEYETEVNSIEANYVVKSRMRRDQLVLQPNGDWVRAATPTRTLSYLAGTRYLKMREDLFWSASDIPVIGAADPTQDGFYQVRTDNDMFGGQLGASMAYETARWSIGAAVKGGAFFNRMDLASEFFAPSATDPNSGITNSTEDNISFVGEFQIQGKWHLRPNMSLRAGFEILHVDSIALAPFQVNFVRGGYNPIANGGDIFCMGSSFGIEIYR